MPGSDLILDISKISGLNNVADPVRMAPTVIRDGYGHATVTLHPVVKAQNVFIGNDYEAYSRAGFDSVVTCTSAHSFWSDGKVCFFVDEDTLYWMHIDYSITALVSGLTLGLRMSYTRWNDRIYCSNGQIIGYIDADLSWHALSDPGIDFKLKLPAGQFIAYYRGHLYIASGSTLYISDALCDHFDIREGFRAFESYINLLQPVKNGLYVAATKTYFLPIEDPQAGFERREIYPFDAVPYTAQLVPLHPASGSEEEAAMWVSSKGIIMGDDKGSVRNITLENFSMGDSDHNIGAGFAWIEDEKSFYIAALSK